MTPAERLAKAPQWTQDLVNERRAAKAEYDANPVKCVRPECNETLFYRQWSKGNSHCGRICARKTSVEKMTKRPATL